MIFSLAHTVVEFSLIMLLALGLFTIANETIVKLVIGVAGGAFLIIFGILAIMAIIYGVSFSLMWFMPKWLRKFLNRTYKREPDKEYTEEELMKLIKNQLNKNKNQS